MRWADYRTAFQHVKTMVQSLQRRQIYWNLRQTCFLKKKGSSTTSATTTTRMTKIKFITAFKLLIVFGTLMCVVFRGWIVLPENWNLASSVRDFIFVKPSTQHADLIALPKFNYASSSTEKTNQTTNNVTIVTAFFNIGSFRKGFDQPTRGPSTYLDWMWPYGFILNGVVAYFDDAALAAQFTRLRQNRPTKVVTVDRSQLWAFSLQNRISGVFMQPGYPKSPPKSTSAEYVAAMHAKYELVARAAYGDDPFGSAYIAWMDLGIYRTLPKSATEEFMVCRPSCHKDDAILFSRVYPMAPETTLESVMRNGIDWVGGGFLVARRDVAISFFGDYTRSVESYLSRNLANHDQSVLLAMYLPATMPRPSVPLQAISPPAGHDPWFYLAMQAREDGLAKKNSSSKSSPNLLECSYNIHS